MYLLLLFKELCTWKLRCWSSSEENRKKLLHHVFTFTDNNWQQGQPFPETSCLYFRNNFLVSSISIICKFNRCKAYRGAKDCTVFICLRWLYKHIIIRFPTAEMWKLFSQWQTSILRSEFYQLKVETNSNITLTRDLQLSWNEQLPYLRGVYCDAKVHRFVLKMFKRK